MSLLLVGSWDAAELARWRLELERQLPNETWTFEPGPDVEAAIVANPPHGALQGMPNLRLIQSVWAGVDRLMQDPTLPEGVPLARMVDPAMNEAMAQTALWAVLGLQRRFFEIQAQQRDRLWRQPLQRRAGEFEVLVMGLGELGGRVARTLAAQGYDVAGWSRTPRDVDGVRALHGDAALAEALARSDAIVNLMPLTPQTRGFWNAARFSACKRGAGFVNLARGAQVDEPALLAALDAGQIGHALLDVFAVEPLPAEHRFWTHPRVTVLPHVAALTDERSAAVVVANNIRALRGGAPIAHLVERGRGY